MTTQNARRGHYHISMSHEVTGDMPGVCTWQSLYTALHTAESGAVTAGWSPSTVTRAGAHTVLSLCLGPMSSQCNGPCHIMSASYPTPLSRL